MKIILTILMLFSFSSTTYAKVTCIETGEELKMLQTTDGWMAFTAKRVSNIDNLKMHTVIVILQEGNVQYRGAGIVIDKRHILTVNHVTSATGRNFYFEHESSQPIWATVVKQDTKHDLAMLEIDKNAPDLNEPMTFNNVQAAETIYTIGHPDTGMYSLTVGETSNNSGRLQIRVHGGNSGGFVMNNKGELVGMITSIQEQVGNLAYMTTTEDIQNFLK